ncbi:MAG: nuclear transport factor 2 family protein [Alphaproteobacteria bacterium]|nr:nuclear transport factor 2 family protein [Alphaproteobacteria bacterium]MBV9150550.1 nuclear transport factor 2 family protein [Alphaproteobacteria bacterium]
MSGESIELNLAGKRTRGYVARPDAGSGPGLLLVGDGGVIDRRMTDAADLYSEEGYVVLAPEVSQEADVIAAAGVLRQLSGTLGSMGGLGFGRGGALLGGAVTQAGLAVLVCYDPPNGAALGAIAAIPVTAHVAGSDLRSAAARNIETFTYPDVRPSFSDKYGAHYDKPAASMAHSRSVAALRRAIGPHYDLSALWERHTYYEFVERDVPKTMATMVAEPYVNHVPTMTGGVGHEALARFYRDHFVNANPKDTKLIPVSRTIGTDRVVDEVLFCFTHDVEIPWMLPGVKPTGRYVEVPLVAIVAFRGNKLYHEHIYWDQASVLAQIGLLDPETLPIGGIDTAKKLVDETLPSNALMQRLGRG